MPLSKNIFHKLFYFVVCLIATVNIKAQVCSGSWSLQLPLTAECVSGQWVGWQVVKKYVEKHPDISLPKLMEIQNVSELFKDSGYRPQVLKVPGKEKS